MAFQQTIMKKRKEKKKQFYGLLVWLLFIAKRTMSVLDSKSSWTCNLIMYGWFNYPQSIML